MGAFHESLGGPQWRSTDNWLQTPDPCDRKLPWYGVRCHKGKVHSIDLSDNGVDGTIPAQIGHLEGLQELKLNKNSISGTLPTELGKLKFLRVLATDSNRVSGTLPSGLNSVRHLSHVDLDDNMLSGTIPRSIGGSLASMTRFELYSNSISGTLPTELGDGGKFLVYFDVDENSLVGAIPSEYGRLTSLQELRCERNAMTAPVPTELSMLRLRNLAVDWERVEGGRPPWVRRSRGRSGKLKHWGTKGMPAHMLNVTEESDEERGQRFELGVIGRWDPGGRSREVGARR